MLRGLNSDNSGPVNRAVNTGTLVNAITFHENPIFKARGSDLSGKGKSGVNDGGG